MRVHEKITSLDSALFRRVDALYAGAFPWHEQRETPAKIRALSHPDYVLEAWSAGEICVGLRGSRTFDGYVYIEHLAIDGALRSQGYGRAVLEQILARSPLTVLEIDPLTSENAHRRLRFYESMGFHANPWPHTHPAYHQGVDDHQLIVLSYPQPIDAGCYRRFNEDLRRQVMAE